MNRPTEAVACYLQAAQLQPNYAECYKSLASALLKLDRVTVRFPALHGCLKAQLRSGCLRRLQMRADRALGIHHAAVRLEQDHFVFQQYQSWIALPHSLPAPCLHGKIMLRRSMYG